MPDKTEKKDVTRAKKKLGKLISESRGKTMSQRQLAAKVGLPPSNMKYIEDGINCPTAEVYDKLIDSLSPTPKSRKEMDQAYMLIRNVPPPDICKRVKNDLVLMNLIRSMDSSPLTEEQAQQVQALLASFTEQNVKGEKNDG